MSMVFVRVIKTRDLLSVRSWNCSYAILLTCFLISGVLCCLYSLQKERGKMEKSHLFPTLCVWCFFCCCFFTVLVFLGIFLACCAGLFLFCHHHISLSCLPYIFCCYLADFVTVYKCFLYPVWKPSNNSSFAPLQLLIIFILCFAVLQNAFALWLLMLLAMLHF